MTQEVRKNMKEMVYEYVTVGDSSSILFFNTWPGSGKTYTTIQTLIENEFIFIYTSPTHRTTKENVVDKVFIPHIESRTRLCQNERFKILESYGVDMSIACKEICADMDVCEYYKRIREIWHLPQSWAGVHSHLPGTISNYLEEFSYLIDVIILDEQFVDSLYKEIKISYPLLRDTLKLLNKMPETNEKTLIKIFFTEISRVVSEGRNIYDLGYIESIASKIDRRRHYNEFRNEYNRLIIDLYRDTGKLFHNVVDPIIDLLLDLKLNIGVDKYLESALQLKFWKGDCFASLSRYRMESLDINKPIIILDATTPPAIYESVFDKEIVPFQSKRPERGSYFQVTDGAYPMESLDQPSTFRRLSNLARLIVETHNRTLIISRKKYKQKIRHKLKGLEGRFDVDHYGGLRGSNLYQDCDSCILFGAPFPNIDYTHRKSTLLKVPYEHLYYMEKEMEMLQALERIRPTLKDESFIYILSKIGRDEIKAIPFITTKKMSVEELISFVQTEYIRLQADVSLNRIRQNILAILEDGEMMRTSLIKKAEGEYGLVAYVLNDMVQSSELNVVERREGSKRPAKFYSIPL